MKKSIYISIFFLSFVILFSGFYSKTQAQVFGINDVVDAQLVPEIPKAGEKVRIYLVSYVTDINLADITWKVNGKTIKNGIGEKIFDFNMGTDSQTTVVEVTIKTKDSGTLNKKFELKPASVDLMWESHGFVPPFYKGKALFGHQDKVTIIAFPHIKNANGTDTNPKTLNYKWKKNSSVMENLSGYGKNTLTIEGSIISRPVTISVEVSSDDGQAYGNIVLNPVDPYVIMYKKDPTYGIQFQKAIGSSLTLTGTNEITVIGFPFFFDSEAQKSRSLFNTWAINGKPINNEKSQWMQTFRPGEGQSGSSNISLGVENPDKILQSDSHLFNLIFNNQEN
jgi:hypothetical protein